MQPRVDYLKEFYFELLYRKIIGKISRRLSRIRQREKQVYASDMTPAEKRKELDFLLKMQNDLFKLAYDMGMKK